MVGCGRERERLREAVFGKKEERSVQCDAVLGRCILQRGAFGALVCSNADSDYIIKGAFSAPDATPARNILLHTDFAYR